MSSTSNLNINEVRELALKYALYNAVKHDGKARIGPVVSKIIGERPEYRKYARDIAKIVKEVVEEVNNMSLNEQIELLRSRWPELLEERREIAKGPELPPLPNVDKYKVVKTRFAPNPDFVLHLGSARPAILCYEYAKRYKGKMILRFEDTDPRIKRPLPEAYKAIKEDLRWLGIKWDEEYIQSLRMKIYYSIARELIEKGGAYVDLCSPNEFRKYRDEGRACPHREKSIEEQLELWDKMIEGYFSEGEAVLRIKTPLDYPDPSVREWVAFRIIDTSKTPHPIVGDKYIVWPTYNFAAAVDDHLMGVTHILRAKEHQTNTIKQKFLYKHLGWEYPEAIHFGRLRLEGFMLSKSKMRELMERGDYEGYSDPRFGTLSALRRRGFLAETIHKIILDVGVKHTDATISFENLAAINRKIVDPIAPRIMFVDNPVIVEIAGLDPTTVEIPLHPSNKELGIRTIELKSKPVKVFISAKDSKILLNKGEVRLMELANVRLLEHNVDAKRIKVELISRDLDYARNRKLQIIQWVPYDSNVQVTIKKPVEDKIELINGLAEQYVANIGVDKIVQFIRVGFVRIDSIVDGRIIAYYTHD